MVCICDAHHRFGVHLLFGDASIALSAGAGSGAGPRSGLRATERVAAAAVTEPPRAAETIAVRPASPARTNSACWIAGNRAAGGTSSVLVTGWPSAVVRPRVSATPLPATPK